MAVSLFWCKCMIKIDMEESRLFTNSSNHVASSVGLVSSLIADIIITHAIPDKLLTKHITYAQAFCFWGVTGCAYYCAPWIFLLCYRTYHSQRPCHWTYSWTSWLPPRECCSPVNLSISTPWFARMMTRLFVLQHEFGDTTNGCISTGLNCPLILIMPMIVICSYFMSYQVLPVFCNHC